MILPLLLLTLTMPDLTAMNTTGNINNTYCLMEIQTCTDTLDQEKFLEDYNKAMHKKLGELTAWYLVIKQIDSFNHNANITNLKKPFNYNHLSVKTMCALNQSSKTLHYLSKHPVERYHTDHEELAFTVFKVPMLLNTDCIDHSTNYRRIHPSWMQQAKLKGYTLDPMILDKIG